MARKHKQLRTYEVTDEFEGETYTAVYSVDSQYVTVHAVTGPIIPREFGPPGGLTDILIGSTHHEIVARELLRRYLEGARKRGEL
jgi:hypothetical protein